MHISKDNILIETYPLNLSIAIKSIVSMKSSYIGFIYRYGKYFLLEMTAYLSNVQHEVWFLITNLFGIFKLFLYNMTTIYCLME
jgi:hypothetical protein